MIQLCFIVEKIADPNMHYYVLILMTLQNLFYAKYELDLSLLLIIWRSLASRNYVQEGIF